MARKQTQPSDISLLHLLAFSGESHLFIYIAIYLLFVYIFNQSSWHSRHDSDYHYLAALRLMVSNYKLFLSLCDYGLGFLFVAGKVFALTVCKDEALHRWCQGRASTLPSVSCGLAGVRQYSAKGTQQCMSGSDVGCSTARDNIQNEPEKVNIVHIMTVMQGLLFHMAFFHLCSALSMYGSTLVQYIF